MVKKIVLLVMDQAKMMKEMLVANVMEVAMKFVMNAMEMVMRCVTVVMVTDIMIVINVMVMEM